MIYKHSIPSGASGFSVSGLQSRIISALIDELLHRVNLSYPSLPNVVNLPKLNWGWTISI